MDADPNKEKDVGRVGCFGSLTWTWTKPIAKSQHFYIMDNRSIAPVQSCGTCCSWTKFLPWLQEERFREPASCSPEPPRNSLQSLHRSLVQLI